MLLWLYDLAMETISFVRQCGWKCNPEARVAHALTVSVISYKALLGFRGGGHPVVMRGPEIS